jgi:spore coat polysaccharide biosynthesis predicted glycosyltransferase SpsG
LVNQASSFADGFARGMRLLLRADAGGLLGSGHVMRCLALGEAWIAEGGEALLACAAIPDALAERAAQVGAGLVRIGAAPGSLEDAAETKSIAAASAALVVDGYVFDANYLDRIDGAAPVLVIDDAARLPAYAARWVLNQNVHAAPGLYAARAAGADLLLGGRYALLRAEFSEPLQGSSRAGLFATFGGVDPYGASFVFLDACARIAQPVPATLAIGPANPRAAEIVAAARAVGVDPIVDVRNMADRLAGADLVITAGGATLWEGCATGAPMLVVSVTPEEEMSANALDRMGGCRHLGSMAMVDPAHLAREIEVLWTDAPARRALGDRAQDVCDGLGARRVARILAMETRR